jgi:hypothetical protein
LSLISTATAATAGPFPATAFPKFATVPTFSNAATSTLVDANTNILPAFNLDGTIVKGPYRGFRNGMYVFPTQNVGAPNGTTATTAPALAAQTTTKTFWALASTEVGSYPSTVVTISATGTPDAGHTSGAFWVVCLDATSLLLASKCAGVGGNITSTHAVADSSRFIPGRLTIIGDKTT